jgi:hypothetical protein
MMIEYFGNDFFGLGSLIFLSAGKRSTIFCTIGSIGTTEDDDLIS